MEFFAVIQTKEKKRTLRNQDNEESFSIPFPEKKLERGKGPEGHGRGGPFLHVCFISLVIFPSLPQVFKFLPWSAGVCYYPMMTSGQLCEETKSLTSLLPVAGFLDNALCEKDIKKKKRSFSVKKKKQDKIGDVYFFMKY